MQKHQIIIAALAAFGNANPFNVPSVCAADAGTSASYACLDWNAGSFVMEAAASEYANRVGLSEVPIFGVGSVGHADTKHNMGKCFEFELEGVTRPLVFQAINEGGDVQSGNVDLQMAAGGEGAFLGCTNPSGGAGPMFENVGSYPSVFGQHPFSGGPPTRASCNDLPEWATANADPLTGSMNLQEQCKTSFDLKLRLNPQEAAMTGNSNPRILTRKWIPCPRELVALTKLARTDDPTEPIDQASDLTADSHTTRMMDCCKPSAGWVGNTPNADPNSPAVMSCQADGFTRLDGSIPAYYGQAPPSSFSPTSTVSTNAPTTSGTLTSAPTPSPMVPSGGCCTWDVSQGCQKTSGDWCGASESRCSSCGGLWIGGNDSPPVVTSPPTSSAPTIAPTTSTPTLSPSSLPSSASPTISPTISPSSLPSPSSGCCTWNVAQGCQKSSTDWCGVSEARCSRCGGQWIFPVQAGRRLGTQDYKEYKLPFGKYKHMKLKNMLKSQEKKRYLQQQIQDESIDELTRAHIEAALGDSIDGF